MKESRDVVDDLTVDIAAAEIETDARDHAVQRKRRDIRAPPSDICVKEGFVSLSERFCPNAAKNGTSTNF